MKTRAKWITTILAAVLMLGAATHHQNPFLVTIQDQSAAWGGSSFTFQTVSVDFTLADPTAAPTIGAETPAGSCTNAAGQTYKFAVAWFNPSGATGVGVATSPYTTSTTGRRVSLTRPSAPTGVGSWEALYAKGSEAYATWRECANGSLIAVGTTSTSCTCAGTNVWGSNTTGVISPVSFMDGEIRSSKTASVSDPRLTIGAYRFKTYGTTPTFSSDAGVNYYSVALDSPQVRHVCATTCPYSTITAAVASISGQSTSNRFTILVEPGDYNESPLLKDYVFVVGRERSSTRVLAFTIPTDFHEIGITNLTTTGGSSIITAGGANAYHGRLMVSGCNLGDPDNLIGSAQPIDSILCCGDTANGIEIFDFGNLHRTTYDTLSVWPRNTVYAVGSTYIIKPGTNTTQTQLTWLLYYPGSTFIGTGLVIVMDDQGNSSVMDSKQMFGPRYQGGTSGGSAGHTLILKDSVFLVTATSATRTAATAFWGDVGTTIQNLGPSLVDISGTSISISSASSSGIVAVDYIADGSDTDRGNWKFRQYSGSVLLSGGASRSYANVGTGSPAGLTFELGPPLDNVYSSSITGSAVVTYAKGFMRDGDLVADTCVIGEVATDNAGGTREICWGYNNSGSCRWACISATTTNGPTN